MASLTLGSTSASILEFVQEANRLKSQLPADIYETMQRCEAIGDFHNPEYEAAVMTFYQRHLCRLSEWPDCILRTVANLDNNPVYETMNGPNEFMVVGNLKDWDRTNQLDEISVPTLITVGRYDELTPRCAKTLHQGIPNSRLVIFEDSSHVAHIEETAKCIQVIADFLTDVEREN